MDVKEGNEREASDTNRLPSGVVQCVIRGEHPESHLHVGHNDYNIYLDLNIRHPRSAVTSVAGVRRMCVCRGVCVFVFSCGCEE